VFPKDLFWNRQRTARGDCHLTLTTYQLANQGELGDKTRQRLKMFCTVIGSLADEYANNPTGECRPPVTPSSRAFDSYSIGSPHMGNHVQMLIALARRLP
jgi:hypothetical protein